MRRKRTTSERMHGLGWFCISRAISWWSWHSDNVRRLDYFGAANTLAVLVANFFLCTIVANKCVLCRQTSRGWSFMRKYVTLKSKL